MEPTYSTGDLVWSRCGEPEVGDIVVYSAPGTDDAHVIHRIIGGNGVDGWVLQGDNNDFVDPWTPDDSHVLGIAAVHIPGLGNLVHSLGNPFIWASLLLLAGALLLWPRPAAGEGGEEGDAQTDASTATEHVNADLMESTSDRTEEEGALL